MNPMGHVPRLHSEALRGGRRLAFCRRHRFAALAGVLLAALAAGEAAGQPGGLFLVVEPAAVFAGPGVQTSPDALTLRRRLVSIDFGQLTPAVDAVAAGVAAGPSGVLRLNLFDDALFTALVERTAPTFSGGYSLSGRWPGSRWAR